MLDQAKMTALRLLPKNSISRAVGALSELELPQPLRGPINSSFAQLAGIDLGESESAPDAYASVNAFFTRRLREGARDIEANKAGDLVSPSDGRLSTFGRIEAETLVQAKGKNYRLVDLVDSGRDAERFVGGHFATVYLSPRDYHRVHSPASGVVSKVSYIPGQLFPVNPLAVRNVSELFAVNERLISYVEEPALGVVGVVMVGATCVGKMSLAFHGLKTNGRFRRREDIEIGGTQLEAGDELGMFNLGSTVVLLIGSQNFEFRSDLTEGMTLRMGELLGRTP